MSHTLLDRAYQLTQAGKPFVLATVVWCERPSSAKPGAQAIIQEDGHLTGWIGGSCAQPVVLREAMRVLREGGDPFLLRLGTSDTGITRKNDEVRFFPMTCASGGALDIYMEPHLPQPQLLLVGDSPINSALYQLAVVLDFAVTHLDSADLSQVRIDERTAILVATHGHYDEDALEQALRSPATYIGMVGSRRRVDTCRGYLLASGVSEKDLARLKAPAGLDIGALTPAEIAASILAELVQLRRRGLPVTAASSIATIEQQSTNKHNNNTAETAIDPICGMIIEVASARHHSTYEGTEFYFCCPACKRLFERDPQKYFAQSER